MQGENTAGALISWLSRLERKVDDLEKHVAEGNSKQTTKSLATCDTYLKKLYARAKEHVFHTADGPQMVRDLARLKVRIERVRKSMARSHPMSTWLSGNLQEVSIQDQFA
jgi:hypothetical protein